MPVTANPSRTTTTVPPAVVAAQDPAEESPLVGRVASETITSVSTSRSENAASTVTTTSLQYETNSRLGALMEMAQELVLHLRDYTGDSYGTN